MSSLSKNIIAIAVIILLVLLFIFIIVPKSMQKSEIGWCNTLQDRAEEYKPHFFVTEGWYNTCKARGIIINAPIKYETKY